MSRNLERLLQKAKAARPQPPSVPGNALPIVTERVERVPAGIDRLIAAGKLSEADRPRCVYWTDFPPASHSMNARGCVDVELGAAPGVPCPGGKFGNRQFPVNRL